MTIEEATYFWVEAGDMSGGSRNQMEFTDEMALFFDEKSRGNEQVFVAFDKVKKGFCTFSNRGQDYDQWVNKWRLSLITKAKGGVDYAGRVVGFEKRKVGQSYAYVITVTDVGSETHEKWRASSSFVGSTAGAQGRAYGYF